MKVEIYTTKTKPLPPKKFPGFHKEKQNMYSAYMEKRESRKYVRRAKKYGFRYQCYDEKYERSSNYRSRFISKNPPINGRYRCVYCGRMIRKSDMEVDHILPVSKAKTKKKIQKKLGGRSVNDVNNLVASCHRCNSKKLDSTSVYWRVKARLGRHGWYWASRAIALLLMMIAVIFYVSGQDIGPINQELEPYILQFENVVTPLAIKFGGLLANGLEAARYWVVQNVH